MPDPVTGMIVAAGSQLIGSVMQADAAESAAETQAGASQAGIAEQRSQFDAVQKLLAPYVQAGTGAISQFQPFQQAGQKAFEQQQALAGLLGSEAQQKAIAAIEGGAGYQAQIQAGEEALLQNASATGGLRGGNIQAALAQFRPQMLQRAIDQQYGRLGGFAGAGIGASEALYRGGQASATGQASQAQALGTNVATLLGREAQAVAGGQLAQGRAFGAIPSAFASGLGTYASQGGNFGGNPFAQGRTASGIYGAENVYGPGGGGTNYLSGPGATFTPIEGL
jgi:hypothetical protein